MIESIGKNFQVTSHLSTPTQQMSRINFTSQPDEFVKPEDEKGEKKKKGLSTGAKWAIAGGVVGAMALIAFYIAKGRVSEAKQLAESINFKPAETLEEAIKFGKENLGIRSYNGFEEKDIHVINWINEALVNTSNKMKGKLRMPKDIVYTDALGDDVLAGVINDSSHKNYGWFGVNKKVFGDIDNFIAKQLKGIEQFVRFEKLENGGWSTISLNLLDRKALNGFAEQFIKIKEGNPTLKQKLDFYHSICVLANRINSYNEVPIATIKQLLANPKNKQICEKNNILTDIEKIKTLSNEEQHNIIASMYEAGIKFFVGFDINSQSAFKTIYHEMGHMQDMTHRCVNIDNCNFDYSKYPQELKDWVDNKEYVQTANKVSAYASYGPGEFIAETFAEMIHGNKLPDGVLSLYKKLNGATVPGY
jgi:hypothetical protein